jgi:predicted fused transcriptional regulator/phosphomethylpyrimidine kinase
MLKASNMRKNTRITTYFTAMCKKIGFFLSSFDRSSEPPQSDVSSIQY